MINAIEVELSPEELAGFFGAPKSLNGDQINRDDPYGEYTDIQPISIRNAGLLLRQAREAMDKATKVYLAADAARTAANNDRTAAREKISRAEYRLKISALQPNGGEV